MKFQKHYVDFIPCLSVIIIDGISNMIKGQFKSLLNERLRIIRTQYLRHRNKGYQEESFGQHKIDFKFLSVFPSSN